MIFLFHNPSSITKILAAYIKKGDITKTLWKFDVESSHIYLDAGCGSQVWTLNEWRRYSKNVEIVGLDINKVSLKKMKENVKKESLNVHLVLGDLEHLPFRSCVFDRIKCAEVLEHIENDRLALTELSRVSKKGGLLLLTVPTSISERLISTLSKRKPYHSGHKRIYSKTVLHYLLNRSKFTIINTEYHGFYSTILFCCVVILDIPFDENGNLLKRHIIIDLYNRFWKVLDTLRIGSLLNLLGTRLLPKSIVITACCTKEEEINETCKNSK